MPQAPYLFPIGSRLGADNLVLRAKSAHHRIDGFVGPWSIKTVISGQVVWLVNKRQLVVDPGSLLVMPAGEKYSMHIAAEKPVETCCVFFAPSFVEQIAVDMSKPLEAALDDHGMAAACPPFLTILQTDRDHTMGRQVRELARRCAGMPSPSSFEQEFLEIAAESLRLYRQIRDAIARLPATRSSTRQELLRRLLLAREYFHSHAAGPVSLSTVSRAAGLSVFHLHRCFTQAFGETPHSYLTGLRLARARHLIGSGSSVLEACLEVGFSSPSAFSRLYLSYFGDLPSAHRKLARSGKIAD